MSTNLYWRPIKEGSSLSYTLKTVFRKSGFFRNDYKFTLDLNHLEFLRGLKVGLDNEQAVEEVELLISQIELFSKIEIYEE